MVKNISSVDSEDLVHNNEAEGSDRKATDKRAVNNRKKGKSTKVSDIPQIGSIEDIQNSGDEIDEGVETSEEE